MARPPVEGEAPAAADSPDRRVAEAPSGDPGAAEAARRLEEAQRRLREQIEPPKDP